MPFSRNSGECDAVKQLCDQENSNISCENSDTTPYFAAIKIIIEKVILLRAQHNGVVTISSFSVKDWKAWTAEKPHRHANNKFWTALPALPTTEPLHWAAWLDVSWHIILTLCHPATKMELEAWQAWHHRGFWFISHPPRLCFSRCLIGDGVGWK